MRKITKRAAIFAAAGAVAVATAGTAWAVWSANGTGSASAAAGTSAAVTTSAATLASGEVLVPGGTADVFIKITNPNAFPVKVTGVAANGAITSSNTTCTASTGVTFTPPPTVEFLLSPNGTGEFTLDNAASMNNSSVNECQGATFTIPVSLTAESNATP